MSWMYPDSDQLQMILRIVGQELAQILSVVYNVHTAGAPPRTPLGSSRHSPGPSGWTRRLAIGVITDCGVEIKVTLNRN